MRTTLRVLVPAVALIFGASAAGRAQSGSPSMDAKLVDPEKNAAKKAATVIVTVTGVEMTDPSSVGEKPMKGQGHLHYRVDDGPIIATTSTKLSFHDLKVGAHTFEVVLAANDHNPLGPKQTLKVTVPGSTPTNSH
jgi:hypothetical protein